VSDYSFSQNNLNVAASITPAPLSASLTNSGVTKVYDASTAAPNGFAPTYNITGFISGDTAATLTNTGSAFNSANVTTANAVITSGLAITSITGSNASAVSDYSVNTSASVAATISPATLTSSGITANDKIYNAQSDTTLNLSSAMLMGVISGDSVAINPVGYSAIFENPNPGNNIPVTVIDLALAGSSASNYQLTQPTGLTANIIPNNTPVPPTPNPAPYQTVFPTNFITTSGPVTPLVYLYSSDPGNTVSVQYQNVNASHNERKTGSCILVGNSRVCTENTNNKVTKLSLPVPSTQTGIGSQNPTFQKTSGY